MAVDLTTAPSGAMFPTGKVTVEPIPLAFARSGEKITSSGSKLSIS